jgi:phage/plasmid-associated DNA primase
MGILSESICHLSICLPGGGPHSLPAPTQVLRASRRYIDDNDIVKDFVQNHLTVSENQEDMIEVAQLHTMYLDAYNSHGLDAVKRSRQWFKQQMENQGVLNGKNRRRGPLTDKQVFFGVLPKADD